MPTRTRPQPIGSYFAGRVIRCLLAAPVLIVPAAGSEPDRRIVHQFDFDERGAGNAEEVPKHWEPLREFGFSRFSRGRFDATIGHDAPPSFRLNCEGRDVAYQYVGPDTRLVPHSDYRVEGYFRGAKWVHARACLSAHFADQSGMPLLDTLVRTRYVGGPDEADGWHRLELYLPPPPPQADAIVLTVWLLQRGTWNAPHAGERDIRLTDIHAQVWFDDIKIFALPRLTIESSAPGNVFSADSEENLLITLTDFEDSGWTGRVSIEDADGVNVLRHDVPVQVEAPTSPTRIPVGHLPPGVYRASAEILSDDRTMAAQSLRFARVAPRHRPAEPPARTFGIILDPHRTSDAQSERAMLQRELIRSAKIPMWSTNDARPYDAGDADRRLHHLARKGFALTAVFAEIPDTVGGAMSVPSRSVVQLLSDDPSEWRESLARVVAPFAGLFHQWQVGADGDEWSADPERLERAVTQLRAEMGRYMTAPRLAGVARADVEPPTASPPFEGLCLSLSSELAPDDFPVRAQAWKSLEPGKLSACVPPLRAESYDRKARLADWGRRLIAARHAGFDPVYVPQTWGTRSTASGLVTEPDEEFIILRTLADLLGDAAPGPVVPLAASIQGYAFHDGDSTMLALWDLNAPPDGREVTVQLGSAERQIDLWGAERSLMRDDRGRQIVRVSPAPVLIDRVTRWLVEFQTAVAIAPVHLQSGGEIAKLALTLPNNHHRPIAGALALRVPESWTVQPRRLDFHVAPRQTQSLQFEIRYPHNEPAGTKNLIAEVTFADGAYVEIALPVEIGLSDVDVRGLAFFEHDTLRLRQTVTNRAAGVLNLRGSAVVPGRQRQYRPLANLQPGQTQTLEFRFADAATLIGSKVRLELRSTDDAPRTHALELVVP